MRTRNPPEKRRRIFAAATADFSKHGIAGARVDRIAAEAGVSKAQMYAYYGDKFALFGAVVRAHANAIVDETPFTAEDLPGYAVALYEAARARPDVIRLLIWARLECVEFPLDADGLRAKLDAIAEAQAAGTLDPAISPENVLALLSTMALTWTAMGPLPTAARHDENQAALRHAVAQAFERH
ncbi:TetR family transcriptional regulator [Actinoplanes sp. NPDC051470]|uniref:TetR/AcrR family transcriptional regulator n=1 Tax=Actinoplanes sp. NPDC051470 TaxID=3157224 RepID=UPI00343B28D0